MFISIEGVEGVGKTCQMENIELYFYAKKIAFVDTREPGGTPIAEKIRSIIMEDIDPITEAYLFCAARREHVEKLIKPALKEGKVVISDRFVDSSVAYQGIGRGLGMDFIWQLNQSAIDGCIPDKTIYLDLDPEIGLRRISKNNRETNRLDNQKIEFYKKSREGFLKLSKLYSERYVVINANQTPEQVFEDIKNKVLIPIFG